jgi:hypothetical protein
VPRRSKHGTDVFAGERVRREQAARVLDRAQEAPVAAGLRRADDDCQRSTGLADVRAELIAGLVDELGADLLDGRATHEVSLVTMR